MRKVLLLEDEDVLGSVYKKKLEAAGYEVQWVMTVEDLEDTVDTFSADVVLLDHGIRGHVRSGSEIIPFLREVLPEAKIIMLSNFSQFQLQDEANGSGADAYLVKINTPPKVLIRFIEGLYG